MRRLEFGSIDLGSVRPPTASTAFPMPKIADARMAESLIIYIRSTCDQAVTVQPVGNVVDDPRVASVFDVGAAQTLAIGSTTETRLVLQLNLPNNWAPYMGVTVAAGGTAPTAGFVFAVAYLRVWQHID